MSFQTSQYTIKITIEKSKQGIIKIKKIKLKNLTKL
jgi:hypothetical protein